MVKLPRRKNIDVYPLLYLFLKQDGTTRLIYAFGKDDPADENSLQYHGTSRGTKSVPLLSPSTTGGNLPDDTKHIDFLNGNVSV